MIAWDLWLLLIAFQAKHFLCDFPWQTSWMLGKGKPWPQFLLPLGLHAGVHAASTFAIATVYLGEKGLLEGAMQVPFGFLLADFALHAIIDRIKASPFLGGRWHPSQPAFWNALALDQLAHGLCYLAYVFFLLRVAE